MNQSLTILKVGGQIVEEDASLQALLDHIAALPGPKVLVHGGGRTATRLATLLGIPTRMAQGRRITDDATLRIVTMVYAGLVNKNIVAQLQARGINAIGLTGADANLILAERRPPQQGLDYGYVGDVRHVDAPALARLIRQGLLPVLAPITHDQHGQLLNTNADTIAGQTAQALAPHFQVTLTFCFEKPGVLDPNNQVIPRLTPERFHQLQAQGTIREGMIPKLQNAFQALQAGVHEVIITQADDPAGIHGTHITAEGGVNNE